VGQEIGFGFAVFTVYIYCHVLLLLSYRSYIHILLWLKMFMIFVICLVN